MIICQNIYQNVEMSNISLSLCSDLSKIINSAKYNYNFYTGYNLWDWASSAKRLPALKPIINPGNDSHNNLLQIASPSM